MDGDTLKSQQIKVNEVCPRDNSSEGGGNGCGGHGGGGRGGGGYRGGGYLGGRGGGDIAPFVSYLYCLFQLQPCFNIYLVRSYTLNQPFFLIFDIKGVDMEVVVMLATLAVATDMAESVTEGVEDIGVTEMKVVVVVVEDMLVAGGYGGGGGGYQAEYHSPSPCSF